MKEGMGAKVGKNRVIFIAVVFQILCVSLICPSVYSENIDAVVNVRGGGRPLSAIIRDVASQTGYRIEISESLLGQKVSGHYQQVELESFFNRIFKGQNIFQVIDNKNRIVQLHVTARSRERVFVVTSDEQAGVTTSWLDTAMDGGVPGMTNRDFSKLRSDAAASYAPENVELDGEPGRTNADLIKERELVHSTYDYGATPLDGESGKTNQQLQDEHKAVFSNYDPASQELDGEPGKTDRDLQKERAEVFGRYNMYEQPLDGEPGKTFQDLLDEREQVFKLR